MARERTPISFVSNQEFWVTIFRKYNTNQSLLQIQTCLGSGADMLVGPSLVPGIRRYRPARGGGLRRITVVL